jgi:hypothetical protein
MLFPGKANTSGNHQRKCIVCEILFTTYQPNQKVCGEICRKKYNYDLALKKTPSRQRGLSSGSVGAMSELRICADLLRLGYYVFRSVGPNSPYDVIAVKHGKLLKIEIRTGILGASDKPYFNKRTNHSHDLCDVFGVYVEENDSIFYDPPLKNIETSLDNEEWNASKILD